MAADVGNLSTNMLALVEDREVWPFLVSDAISATAAGNTPAALTDDFAALAKAPAGGERRLQASLRDLSGVYKLNAAGERIIEVTMDIEFAGPDREEQLSETICRWLDDNAVRADAPYVIQNVRSNNNLITDFTVTETGALASAGSGSGGAGQGGSSTGPAEAEAGSQMGSFTAKTEDGATSNFGGVMGRRQSSEGSKVQRPGGLLSGAGDGGSSFTPPDASQDQGAGAGGFNRPRTDDASKSAIDLDKIAPIPARPSLYPAGSTVHRGKVTFEVKLKGAVAASAAPTEVQ
jgi:hypothetical protein